MSQRNRAMLHIIYINVVTLSHKLPTVSQFSQIYTLSFCTWNNSSLFSILTRMTFNYRYSRPQRLYELYLVNCHRPPVITGERGSAVRGSAAPPCVHVAEWPPVKTETAWVRPQSGFGVKHYLTPLENWCQ